MDITLNGIANSVIAGVFSVLAIVIPLIINKYLDNKQAAATLSSAIDNSLGAIQQAIQAENSIHPIKVTIPGIDPTMATGVQYVLDHAGPEAARFGITPQAIAEKISAKIGLANIQTNIAISASPEPSPLPLSKVVQTPGVSINVKA